MIKVRAHDVRAAVVAHYAVKMQDLTSPSKDKRLVRARWAGMKVSHEITDASLNMVAKTFGRTNHTTVIHGVRRLSALMERDDERGQKARAVVTAIRMASIRLALDRQQQMMPRLLTYQPIHHGESE